MNTTVKIIACSLILISPFFWGFTQIYNDDYSKSQKLNLYKDNKVWMVYGWTFPYEKGKQQKKGKKTSFERFDRDGNRTEEIAYDLKGNTLYSCQYLYDEKGNEIKKMGGSGEEMIYDKWQYTIAGNKIERRSEYKKGKEQKWIFAYDSQKNLTEETYYDISGAISYKWVFLYDENQNVTEKKELDPYGNVYQKWVFKYDDKENNTELYHYVSNNQLYRIYQMRYDKKGNMKSKFTLDKDENVIDLTIFVYQFYEGLHAPRTIGNKQ